MVRCGQPAPAGDTRSAGRAGRTGSRGWAAPASWRKRDQLCPAPRSFPAPPQWAFGNTVRSREQGRLRGSQRRGLGGRARPLPGASAAWWARGRRFRLPPQGERRPARAGLGEAEEPGRGRSWLSKAAARGRSFLLVWFPAAKHLVPPGEGHAGFGARRGSARGRSGSFATSPPPIRGPQHLRVLNHRLFDARPPRFGFVTFDQM